MTSSNFGENLRKTTNVLGLSLATNARREEKLLARSVRQRENKIKKKKKTERKLYILN